MASILAPNLAAPASHIIRRPSPVMPGIINGKKSSARFRPKASLSIFLLLPKPPVQTMTALPRTSIPLPSPSVPTAPHTLPSSWIRLTAGVPNRISQPSSFARSVMALIMALAARGPITPFSGLTMCQVAADSLKYRNAPANSTPISSSHSMVSALLLK